MKHVVCYDKIKAIFETTYQQVVKAPFAETARLFKKQWDDLVESVASVSRQPVYAGVGPVSKVWMNEARNEVKDAALHMTKKIEREAIDSIPKSSHSSIKDTGKNAIKNVKFYSTRIDNQVEEIEKMPLPQTIAATFKDSNYRTVITKENITVYRAFGGHADAGGTFATTSPAVNRIHTKIDLALLPEWKNTRNYEAVIEVPKGTILNIGRAEQQMTKTGSILKGDADQILLPLNYPLEWIKEIRRIPSK